MNFDRLSAFVAVAQAGSFTAAADRLGRTKSALSQGISLLERELGVQLLHRSTRRLSLTEDGARFLDQCQALLSQAELLMEQSLSGKARPTGTLKLTSVAGFETQIAECIALYLERYPHMRVDYVPTDQRLDLIEGGFDLGLRIGMMRDSRMRAAKLADLELVLVASNAYLQRNGVPKTPADLAKHEWIAYSMAPTPWSVGLRARSGKSWNLKMKGRISVTTGAAHLALALVGAGIAAMPQWGVQANIESGRLIRLLPHHRLITLHFFAVYPGTIAPPAKTRAFIDLIKERSSAFARA